MYCIVIVSMHHLCIYSRPLYLCDQCTHSSITPLAHNHTHDQVSANCKSLMSTFFNAVIKFSILKVRILAEASVGICFRSGVSRQLPPPSSRGIVRVVLGLGARCKALGYNRVVDPCQLGRRPPAAAAAHARSVRLGSNTDRLLYHALRRPQIEQTKR